MITDQEFYRTVQNPETRTRDTKQLIKLSLEALKESESLFVRASATCVLIYRYIEGHMEASRLREVHSAALLIALELKTHTNRSGDWMRWATSLNMAIGYLHLYDRSYSTAVEHFKDVIANSDHLTLWPTMVTSSVSACLFAGSAEAKLGNVASGISLFKEGGKIFRSGVSLLNPMEYWHSHELIGASSNLHECNNERLILEGQSPVHERGSRLWGIYKMLMVERIVA